MIQTFADTPLFFHFSFPFSLCAAESAPDQGALRRMLSDSWKKAEHREGR